MSHNSVLCLLEDHDGIMWIGTRGGLNKYNGIETQVYEYSLNDSLSLSNNHVNCLFETSKQELWIGTANGLNRYLPTKDGFNSFFVATDSTGISNRYVKCITETEKGEILVGTSNGLNLYSPESNSFEHLFIKEPPTYSNNIISLFADDEGRIWVGTKGGLYLMA